MKIGYFADGPWAHKAIDGILSNSQIKISFICLRYEQPDSFLRSVALVHNIPCLVEKNVNSDSFISACHSIKYLVRQLEILLHWEL